MWIRAIVAGIALALAPCGSGAADTMAGRAKAAGCVVCHGQMGISTAPDAPHLAGQPAIYIEEQLKNFRSGKRQHEVMAVIAKPLNDVDIANLAAWYSAIKVEATPP